MRSPFVLSAFLACSVLVGLLPAQAAGQIPSESSPLVGVVLDATGAAIVNAPVVVQDDAGHSVTLHTDQEGRFVATSGPGAITLRVSAPGFEPVVATLAAGETDARIVLQPSTVHESVTIDGSAGGVVTSTGMKTPTPLRDVPQAVAVVSREQIRDLGMQGMSDVMRYVPGVGVAQGESNRDAPVLRGSTTTGDFFIDGVRDDAQYYRDLYNVDRVEVLKGPNAMAFGRGGVGGVVNRVSKQADWSRVRDVSLQAGSFDNRRFTADVGNPIGGRAAVRVTGVFEDSGSYRQGVELERQGVTPSLALTLGDRTMLHLSTEYFHDRRTADRGVPSLNGRPIDTDASTFFGNPDVSYAEATVSQTSIAVDRMLGRGVSLRNRTQIASYDKFYQNVFPGAVNGAAATVAINGYNNSNDRTNVFNQTDLLLTARTGRLTHHIATGAEFGRQASQSLRKTAYFTTVTPTTTSVSVPIADPVTSLPVAFLPAATDANANSVATVAAAYVQDQVRINRFVELVAGIRYDRFQVDATDHRSGDRFESDDNLTSPRVGVVFKPREAVSIYSSYTLAYQPRAGEQLTSLSLTNRTLDPETYRNVEAGAKWDVGAMSVTGAVYRLRRSNVAIASPDTPGLMILVDGQQTQGVELGLSGRVTRLWNVIGAYAYQQGTISTTQSATILAGNRLGQIPAHSFSLWNRYDITRRVGAGLGVIRRGQMFVAADDAVLLPAFTRVDGGLFVGLAQQVRLQVNLENLFDTRYFASAHSNNNITPGSPRAIRVAIQAGL